MKKLLLFVLSLLFINLSAQELKVDKNDISQVPTKSNFYEIQKEFYKKWQDRSPEKGQGYNVFKRWENQTAPRVYPSGDTRLLSATYGNYIKWRKENPETINRSAPNSWSSLGPMSVPSGYDSGVGRVDFIKFHPTNSDIIFIGTPDGGLWKTTNGGASWSTNTDFLGVIGCSDLVINPDNPDIMYLATGNWEGDRRSIGVLKTTDGGDSWNTTSLSWTATDNYKIRRMVMDTMNPNIMMVATDGGVFRTTDAWSSAPDNSGLDGNYNLYDLKYKPGSSDVVYASGVNGSEVFWKSIDKGVSWTASTAGLPSSGVSRIIIGVSIHDDEYVYLLAGNNNGGYLGLYRSVDQGLNFSTRSTTPNLLQSSSNGSGTGGQAEHDLAIAVSPSNVDDVIVGGINQWRSLDGGVNWTLFSYWLGIDDNYPGDGSLAPYIHADIQDIQYLPGSSTTLFVSSDGGIYKSENINDPILDVKFAAISNNLSVAQQTNVAQSTLTKSIIVTGLQDIGTLKKTGSSYAVINGGDGESAFIDRTADNVIVSSNPNGSHQISYDGGATKQDMLNIPAGPSGPEFYSPVSQDPTNPNIMYVGGRPEMYKNIDFFNFPDTWVSIGNPSGAGNILEYVVAPSNSDIIYTIKSDAISKTVNGGTSWIDVTANLPLSSARATQITVSNTNPDKIWVTFSGYSAANKVWTSTTGGSSWTNISSGLPNLPFNTVVYVKDSPVDEIFVGGDIGVYQYQNPSTFRGPGSWTPYIGTAPNSALPNTKVTDLEIFYPSSGSPELRASTYGRGTWATEIQPSVVPVEIVTFEGEIMDNGNLLNWETAMEVNLDLFEVESSQDGENYKKIGNVKPFSSNSNELQSYTFLDRNAEEGLNYYRLKIVDLDGSEAYSKTVVLYNQPRDSNISINPNPSSDIIEIKGLTEGDYRVSVRDVSGRIVLQGSLESSRRFAVNTLLNGNYFIEISKGGGIVSVKKFLKI